jgi:hypothetical protein
MHETGRWDELAQVPIRVRMLVRCKLFACSLTDFDFRKALVFVYASFGANKLYAIIKHTDQFGPVSRKPATLTS